MKSLLAALDLALQAREQFTAAPHISAFRLFNGFLEGFAGLSIEVFARTLVIFDLARSPSASQEASQNAVDFLASRLPWINSILVKSHHASTVEAKRGLLVVGNEPDTKIYENNVWYCLRLTMNQDASLYLDTRNLRIWVKEKLSGLSVLNTFAYTGSLGVAARAGNASRVVHLDLNQKFLSVAMASYGLNGFPVRQEDFIAGDFFAQVGRLKRSHAQFDCVLLDPPLFSRSLRSRFDMNADTPRLVNKVRPLINDGGWLVAVNNSLFLSGRQYLDALENLCSDGFLSLVDLIPVPDDCIGYPSTRCSAPVTDPAPFNHSTKIAVLKVKRK